MPPHNQHIGSAIGMMLVGMIVVAAWSWAAHAELTGSLIERLTSADYVLLAVFVIVGLIAANLVAGVARALMQTLVALIQVALLLLVVMAGVVLWRSYRDGERPFARFVEGWEQGIPIGTANPIHPLPPPVAPPPLPPEEQRKRLEAQLLELDQAEGREWWEPAE